MKCSIMIIDDDEADRYLVRRLAKKLDLASTILECPNGQQAIDLLRDFDASRDKFQDDFPPMIIFLDVNMPLMNGFQFLEQYSQLRHHDDRYQSSVFVMLTSSGRQEDVDRANSYEFVGGFVTKDKMTAEVLSDVVSQCLGRQ